MNGHNVIRVLAIILAILLIAGIFNLIFYGIRFALFIFKDDKILDYEKDYTIVKNIEGDEKKVNDNISKLNKMFKITDIDNIDIDLSVTKLELRTGNEFILKSNNPYLKVTEKGNLLKIIDETKGNFTTRRDLYFLEIQIPNKIYDEFKIETGVAKVDIEDITVKELILSLGVGKTNLENVKVLDKTDINMGVGECNINGILHNKTNIDGGVGRLEVKLEDDIQNYTFKIDKGLGKVEINNKIVKNDNKEIGNGSNYIKINGGIGEIFVKTAR